MNFWSRHFSWGGKIPVIQFRSMQALIFKHTFMEITFVMSQQVLEPLPDLFFCQGTPSDCEHYLYIPREHLLLNSQNLYAKNV